MTGPLAVYANSFSASLAKRGYTPTSAQCQLGLMAHLSRWAADQGLQPGDLITPDAIDRFLALRRAQGRKEWISLTGMAPLLEHLRDLGIVSPATPKVPATSAELLLDAYQTYLVSERALASSTIRSYLDMARKFLAHASVAGRQNLEGLTAPEVLVVVQHELQAHPRASAQYVVSGTRAFLRFLFIDGRIPAPLAGVVPKAARWRLQPLPRSVDAGDIERLVASCDRDTATGLRALAVVTVLVRLGLRAGEVANLKLADLGWRRGEIMITGKGRRTEPLPMPTDVGEAIATWLKWGRPSDAGAYVFCRLHAPHRGLTHGGVAHIVQAACVQAGITPFYPHRLRHAAATQMLRAGADLTEIGQVLRHSRADTTLIYAKVDEGSLRALAMPWPGASS
jgi:site-specific recombinase XerD